MVGSPGSPLSEESAYVLAHDKKLLAAALQLLETAEMVPVEPFNPYSEDWQYIPRPELATLQQHLERARYNALELSPQETHEATE